MELTEHLSAKYGYELESYVEEYKTTLEYQEKLGPSLNSDGEVIIRRSPESVESPCTRYNSFILARKIINWILLSLITLKLNLRMVIQFIFLINQK